MKKKIFDIIQIGDRSNLISRAFDIFIVICIISNILVMILQTFDGLAAFGTFFAAVEYATIAVFIVEYILRIWTAGYLYPDESALRAKIHFILSFNGIIDLLTIIPAFFLSGFVALRMLRVVRILKLFRLNARYDSFNVITTVLHNKLNQIISSVFIILVLMVASSLCMYSAEHTVQPDVFSNAFSGFWWAVNAVLTVGYGDIYPVTIVGKLMAIIISFLGVGVVAIPTGIISAGFVEQYNKSKDDTDYRQLDLSEIAEILVEDSLSDRTISDIQSNCNISVILVIRDGMSILPDLALNVKYGDILVARILKIEQNASSNP
jgi:voltage-gated potassium channel